MVVVREGRIEGGRLIVADTIALPDGTPVRVEIEVLDEQAQSSNHEIPADEDLLPGFGMWANRQDMQDSVDWANQQRDAWRERLLRAQ
jgi:hypothetical protein